MLLKRLELFGFKSFASKTTLEFPSGVTAVVGPNGSGKSNVIDALRWILGERDAKKIRAGKSENLIFNGGAGKAPAGFAEVTIVFDNSSGFFDLDFKEVSVRRRVKRTGQSSYYLNDSEVRLKDIVDFFSKARMGTKGFSIINQGNADMFIRASESERRIMLEEVLGLRQYQLKRKDAEKKLETTKDNLSKANALIEELLPHLRLLRRQSKKWEKHDEIKLELENLQKTYFGARLFELSKKETAIEPLLKNVEAQIAEATKELNQRKAELEGVEKSQPKEEDKGFASFKEKQSKLLNEKSALQKELGRLEAELDFLKNRPKITAKESDLLSLISRVSEKIGALKQMGSVEEVRTELANIETDIKKTIEGEREDTSSKEQEIETKKQEISSKLEKIEVEITELGTQEDKLTSGLREFNESFKAAFTQVEKAKDGIANLETEKRKHVFEKERIELRREELNRTILQYDEDPKSFTAIEPTGEVNIETMERRVMKLRGDLASIGDIDPEVLKEAKDMEERYEFLQKQIEDLEGARKDLRNLIKELKEKIHSEFKTALVKVNEHFNEYFHLMFAGGKAKLNVIKQKAEEGEDDDEVNQGGLEIEVTIPRKNIRGLDMLSGGERSLVSIAVLFALISVSPPPFLVLDEVDAALDENNTKRFADLIKDFAQESQFIVVTHNRATMTAANVLYGVTMGSDGTSKVLSIDLEKAVQA